MGVEKHKKRDIARHQVEAAIVRYEAGDFIPAITLAGAGEEILGRMATATGQANALAMRQVMIGMLYTELWPGETTTPKRVADVANTARNELKHENSGRDALIEFDPKAEAEDMLDRAIENYFVLTQDQTAIMRRYLGRRHAA